MADPTLMTQSINLFAAELVELIHQSAPSSANIVVSPISVLVALAIALLGATDQTFEQLRAGLHLDNVFAPPAAGQTPLSVDAQRTIIAEAFQRQLGSFENSSQLHMANKVYVQQDYHIRQAFEQLVRQQFGSETQSLDFGNSSLAADVINAWVEQKTNHLVRDLFAADAFDAATRMVLVNAVHFKGSWKYPFSTDGTRMGPFWTSQSEHHNVEMMSQTEYYRSGFWKELDAMAVELPYEESNMTMLVVLPNNRTGLAKLVGQLKSADLIGLRENNMSEDETLVMMPKFKIEFDIKLPEVLEQMGITNMFGDEAKFGNMLVEAESLKVSEIVHKASIEVNEEGSEAAAATGLEFHTLSMPSTFIVNHPFWFTIYDGHRNPIVTGIFKGAKAGMKVHIQ